MCSFFLTVQLPRSNFSRDSLGNSFTLGSSTRQHRTMLAGTIVRCDGGAVTERESRKRKFSTRMRSPTHWGGRSMPGDHAPPQGGAWAPLWAFCYVITDLRIYPPPSPSHAPTRSRASTNQVTAGGKQRVQILGHVFGHTLPYPYMYDTLQHIWPCLFTGGGHA
jgi:hypothetical protein